MAVTAIWNVKGRIDLALSYTQNPDKTINPKQLENVWMAEEEAEAVRGTMRTSP